MADYKKMYFELFNKVTDVIKELQDIQIKTERMFIEHPEPEIIELKTENGKSDIDNEE